MGRASAAIRAFLYRGGSQCVRRTCRDRTTSAFLRGGQLADVIGNPIFVFHLEALAADQDRPEVSLDSERAPT
jgi:hypothetical protein